MCVKDMTQLRLFQMEKMVVRAEVDSTIMMRDTAVDSHVTFRKELINKYMYQCTVEKIPYYVYSLIEILCFQCGYFSWNDLITRK